MEWNKKEKNEARKKALSNVNNSIYAHMPSYESAVLIKKIKK